MARDNSATGFKPGSRRRAALLAVLLLAAVVVVLTVGERLTQPHTTLRCAHTVVSESFGPETTPNPPLKATPEEAMDAFLAAYRPSPPSHPSVLLPYSVYRRTASSVTFLHRHDSAIIVTLGGSSARNVFPHPLGSTGSDWAVAQISTCA
jgi:hypothetical protein